MEYIVKIIQEQSSHKYISLEAQTSEQTHCSWLPNMNSIKSAWNDPQVPLMIQQRNKKFEDIASVGHNCIRLRITKKEDIVFLKTIVNKYGEDGKYGVRLHKPPKNHMKLIQNTVLVSLTPLPYNLSKIKNPIQLNFRFEHKEDTMSKLDQAVQWMKDTEHLDTVVRQCSAVELIIGHYRFKSCSWCKRPRYEHVKSSNGFDVCNCCGTVYPGSNITHSSHCFVDDEGTLKKHLLNCPMPGVETEDPSPFVNHRIRASRRLKAMIDSLGQKLRCDEGDADGYLRRWAYRVFDMYEDQIKYRGRIDPDFSGKLKMGQWQLACVFMWFSILFMEKRTKKASIWSLSVICEAGSDLQESDPYIPNWNARGVKRKTRALRLETVHKYALQIKDDMGDAWKKICGFDIPSLHSIDCTRINTVQGAINKYAQSFNKARTKVHLPQNTSWDIDIVREDDVIKIKPDIGGVGFESGLRHDDILIEVNGTEILNTVDEVYEQIVSVKRRKCEKNVITLTILR